MELSPSQLKDIRKDSILVRALLQPETRRGIYIPDSARKVMDKKRTTWEGEVVRIGAGIEQVQWAPERVDVGDILIIAPEAVDCPWFTEEDGNRYIFIRGEDVIAKKVIVLMQQTEVVKEVNW